MRSAVSTSRTKNRVSTAMTGKEDGRSAPGHGHKAVARVKTMGGGKAVRGAQIDAPHALHCGMRHKRLQQARGHPLVPSAPRLGHKHLAQGGQSLANILQGNDAHHLVPDPRRPEAARALAIKPRDVRQVRLVGQGDGHAEFLALDAGNELPYLRRDRGVIRAIRADGHTFAADRCFRRVA